jgi:mercuric ion transport protein
MRSRPKEGAGVLGLGAAACAACCAGPIIAFLGGIAAFGAIGTLLLGVVALMIAAALIAVVVVWRRRGARCEVEPTPVVTLDSPVRRTVTQG